MEKELFKIIDDQKSIEKLNTIRNYVNVLKNCINICNKQFTIRLKAEENL